MERSDVVFFISPVVLWLSQGILRRIIACTKASLMHPTSTNFFPFDWSYPIAFIWGLLAIFSLAGWGQALGQLLLVDRNQKRWVGDWQGHGNGSLFGAWGRCSCCHFFPRRLLHSFYRSDWPCLRDMFIPCEREKRLGWDLPPSGLKVSFGVLCLLILLNYAGAVAEHGYNYGDDFAAYLGLRKWRLMKEHFPTHSTSGSWAQLKDSQCFPRWFSFLPWKYANILELGIAGLMSGDHARNGTGLRPQGVDSAVDFGRACPVVSDAAK